MSINKRAALIILDGWGISPDPAISAIDQAKTPFVDGLYKKYANATLVTHGLQVGLPEGQMGNSEVGHLNIGAGRVVYQELARINKAIESGEFFENKRLNEIIRNAGNDGGKIHLMGLVSDGGVHSHINHLKAFCDLISDLTDTRAIVHAFTDGRDVDPRSGLGFIRELIGHVRGKNIHVASVIGRYYAMDRDKRWERTRKAYDLLVKGIGQETHDLAQAIKNSYEHGITDEFIEPIICPKDDGDSCLVQDGDTVIFFNFRTDRPRQLVTVLTQKAMPAFNMLPLDLGMVTMTSYDDTYENIDVLYEKENLLSTIGEVISSSGRTQLRIAETEKYPHVTFFFSGGREEVFEGEDRILVPSPKVATYDLQPSMSAVEVTDAIMAHVTTKFPDFICLNYANTDMVGHTGVFEAAIQAAETVDTCLSRLLPLLLENDYGVIIIADHGNSDTMLNPDGSVNTAHTKNPVPVIFATSAPGTFGIDDGILADVAPTLLHIMGMEPPAEMTGRILLSKK